MDLFLHLLQALALGIVQGLTEFLPVSSSAHLTIVPWLFGWETPGLVFDTSLHLGTAAALLLFFWKDFWKIIQSILIPKSFTNKGELKDTRTLTFGIILGILPAGIIGFIFDKQIETLFSPENLSKTIYIVSFTLIFFGVLLFMADKYGKKKKTLTGMSIKDAFLIGLMQVCSLIPGTSRSGSTMTAGMALGYTREQAARFSFLLGTPIIILAGLFKLKDLFKITMDTPTILYFITGFLASFISGYFVIAFFIKFLQKHTVTSFTIYRILLALCISLFAFLR